MKLGEYIGLGILLAILALAWFIADQRCAATQCPPGSSPLLIRTSCYCVADAPGGG